MKDLNFSTNWNNKLDCKAFTTLRLSDKYDIGDSVCIKMRNIIKGAAKVVDKKSFLLHQINNFIAEIDTGYSANECKDILKKMYHNKNIDWNKQKIYFYLLKYDLVNTKKPPKMK